MSCEMPRLLYRTSEGGVCNLDDAGEQTHAEGEGLTLEPLLSLNPKP